MTLYTPPFGKFISAYFADWIIVAIAEEDTGEQVLDIYLKFEVMGELKLTYLAEFSDRIVDFDVSEQYENGLVTYKVFAS